MINQQPLKGSKELKVVPNDKAVNEFINRRKPKPKDPSKKTPVPLYLPPPLLAEIDADVEADFTTRNAWLIEACKFYLQHKRTAPKF
jgi:hypothetical protein